MLEKNEMIFGVRAVIEAIQAGREIDKVLVKKDIQSELSKELFTCLKNTVCRSPACLPKISPKPTLPANSDAAGARLIAMLKNILRGATPARKITLDGKE